MEIIDHLQRIVWVQCRSKFLCLVHTTYLIPSTFIPKILHMYQIIFEFYRIIASIGTKKIGFISIYHINHDYLHFNQIKSNFQQIPKKRNINDHHQINNYHNDFNNDYNNNNNSGKKYYHPYFSTMWCSQRR